MKVVLYSRTDPRSEIRTPKAETRSLSQQGFSWTQRDSPASGSDFGFRISAFFRPSDFGLRPSSRPRSREQGIALVVTLLMLSVITFMAIAFLVLSRGERTSTATATDQAIARLGAENALERAQAELVVPMMASGNPFSSGLLVSTNFINTNGFSRLGPPAAYASPTNVAYTYRGGAAMKLPDMLQNLTNLLYNPRPPVFITNRVTGTTDFRYYLDLNRNGAFDPTGWIYVTNIFGKPVLDSKNNPTMDFVQGDPQWIGQLEFPDRHHSADNRFSARYAYLVVPISQALDINYIHNAAWNPAKPTIDTTGAGFFRNQGVGTWEINLAAFLYDLNNNPYAWGGKYLYQPPPAAGFVSGNSFFDAGWILINRYGGINYPTRLGSVKNLFLNGSVAFANHSFDGYTAGPLMTGPSGFSSNPDLSPTPRAVYPWPGADNTNHFFSTQDFFDPTKTCPDFVARLQAASTNVDTYDRYTFYRLLSQLGTDSAPEPPGKINLNYDNRVQANALGVVSATNFIPWKPVDFFTNTAAMLLTNAGFTLYLTNLQVYPTNFYTPSVHRLLQLAANIYDSTTNRLLIAGQTNGFPSVFRPIFRRLNSATNIVVVIAGYREVLNADMLNVRTAPSMVELEYPNPNIASIPTYGTPFSPFDKAEPMVSGIPLVIGAKKGLPNFNELAMQTQIYVSRLLEFRRKAGKPENEPIVETNQMYVMWVTNTFGLEAWNSYLTKYPGGLQLVATMNMTASMTNETGGANVIFSNRIGRASTMLINPGAWRGWNSKNNAAASLILPFGTTNGFSFLTNSTLLDHAPWWEPQTHIFPTATRGAFYTPHWWMNLNTRLLFALVDTTVVPNRIVDYVNINNFERTLDVTTKLTEGNTAAINAADYKNPANQWLTNHLGNSLSTNAPTYGVMNQIQVGLNGTVDWLSFSQDPYSGLDAESAVDGFRYNLMGLSPIYPKDFGKTFYKSNVFYAPFDPYRPIYLHTSWQANDPLVHYTVGDLVDVRFGIEDETNRVNFYSKNPPLDNLGVINTRYRPWGGNPDNVDPMTDYQMAVKDPFVFRSDDWDFPTNKYPNIGWLGRVHRGTPWQTVFLKSTNFMQSAGRFDLSLQNWVKWTGNPVIIGMPAVTNMISQSLVGTNITNPRYAVYDSIFTAPTNDWHILDLFTTAFNENAGRGQLSVNQTNLAAWSAVLSGVSVLPTATATNVPTFILPAGADPVSPPRLLTIVNGINNARTNFPNNAFSRLGDILATPELTMPGVSPYLANTNGALLTDAVIERIPQQILGLLHGGEQPPRFVIYSYGQALKPAPHSIYMGSGPFFGLCTNYQITAEVATRAVVHVEGAPSKPRTVIESFSVIPPD